jgi:hypothetical protein
LINANLDGYANELEGKEYIPRGGVKSPGQLHDYIRKRIGLVVPDEPVCADHVSPFEALCNAYFAKYNISVWKASRGFGGKTLLLAILCFCEITIMGASVTLLGGSSEQSKRGHAYMTGEETNLPYTFWGNPDSPKHLLYTDPSKMSSRLTNGGRIAVLTASQKSVRGPHPQRLRIDEADEADIALIDAALGQPMDSRGIRSQTVISSTHQYANGSMTEILNRVESNPEYNLEEWCYRENMVDGGWLTEYEVARKKAVIPASMWQTEFDLQEPSPKNKAFMTENVDRMFDESLGIYEGEVGCKLIFEKPMCYCPSKKHTRYEKEIVIEDGEAVLGTCPHCHDEMVRVPYILGADWAKEQDYTILTVWRTDEKKIRLVAFYRNQREPWPVMVKRWNYLLKIYDGDAAHDNTGLGDVIDDYLTWYAEGVNMIGKVRSDLLSNYVAAVERDEYIAPMINFMYLEHKRASVADLYQGGKTHHLPDTVSSSALANYAYDGSMGIG